MLGSEPMYDLLRTLYRKARKYLPSTVRPIILAYHIITKERPTKRPYSVEKEKFLQHLEVLKQNYRVISLTELGQCLKRGQVPDNAVAITFDDNYQEHLTVTLPILQEVKMSATVFVCSGSIGSEQEHYWEELERLILLPTELPPSIELNVNGTKFSWELGDEAPANSPLLDFRKPHKARQKAYLSVLNLLSAMNYVDMEAALQSLRAQVGDDGKARGTHRLMTRDQLLELDGSEWIEVGGHTRYHCKLASMTKDKQQDGISLDKRTLEGWLQHPITCFAYPFGGANDINTEAMKSVRKAGYDLAVSTEWEPVRADSDPLFLPRLLINNWTGDEFFQKIRFLGY